MSGTIERQDCLPEVAAGMAETHQVVTKVWIAPGCIVCDACETDCPEVFDVQEETCIIRPEAMKPDFTKGLTPTIQVAADSCPVDVIKFETEDAEGPEPEGWKELREGGSEADHGTGDGAAAADGGKGGRCDGCRLSGSPGPEVDLAARVGRGFRFERRRRLR
ncbi:MAG: ferredoxin [Planctomycetes bacterium]|nr:ferredoxin [Planctomycetota bacterium]